MNRRATQITAAARHAARKVLRSILDLSSDNRSSSTNYFETNSDNDSLDRNSPYHTSRKPMIQDSTRDHETTTSDTPNYPTIDLTNVGMSSSDNNENPQINSTIGMTNMDLSSSENKEIAYNNGEKR